MKIKFPIKLALVSFVFLISAAIATPAFAAPRNNNAPAHGQRAKAKKAKKVKQKKMQRKVRHAKSHRENKHRHRAHAHRPKAEPVLVKRTVRVPGRAPVVTYVRVSR